MSTRKTKPRVKRRVPFKRLTARQLGARKAVLTRQLQPLLAAHQWKRAYALVDAADLPKAIKAEYYEYIRRFKERADLARKLARRRSEIARKAAETRRQRKIERELQAQKRSEAAHKGWATRRQKQLAESRKREFKKRTRSEKKELQERRGPQEVGIRAFKYADQLHFVVDDYDIEALKELVGALKGYGVDLMRFLRHVPVGQPGKSSIYVSERGVASTQYYTRRDLNTPEEIERTLGSMLTPGVDYIQEVIIKQRDIAKLPKKFQRSAENAPTLSRGEMRRHLEAGSVGAELPKRKKRQTKRQKIRRK